MKNRWQRGDRGLLGVGGKSAIVDVEKQMSSIKYEADDHTKTDLHVVGAILVLTNLHSNFNSHISNDILYSKHWHAFVECRV